MSHEYLKITTDGGKNWRELKDNANTEEYIKKLSHAAIVRVQYDTGEWHEIECGTIINRGGMYQTDQSVPERVKKVRSERKQLVDQLLEHVSTRDLKKIVARFPHLISTALDEVNGKIEFRQVLPGKYVVQLSEEEAVALYRNGKAKWTLAKHIKSAQIEVALALITETSPEQKSAEYERKFQ